MIRIITPFLLLVTIVIVKAQDISKNAITTNAIGILGRLAAPAYRNDITYERSLNAYLSFSLGIEQGRYEHSYTISSGKTLKELKRTGWAIFPEIRFYPFGKKKSAPRGFFIGSYYKQYFLKEKYYILNSSTNELDLIVSNNGGRASGLGFDLGYKFGKRKFIFEPVLGYAFGSSKGLGLDPRLDPDYRNFETWTILIRAEAKIGICF